MAKKPTTPQRSGIDSDRQYRIKLTAPAMAGSVKLLPRNDNVVSGAMLLILQPDDALAAFEEV